MMKGGTRQEGDGMGWSIANVEDDDRVRSRGFPIVYAYRLSEWIIGSLIILVRVRGCSYLRQLCKTNNERTRSCSSEKGTQCCIGAKLRVRGNSPSSSDFSNRSRRFISEITPMQGTGRQRINRVVDSLGQEESTCWPSAGAWRPGRLDAGAAWPSESGRYRPRVIVLAQLNQILTKVKSQHIHTYQPKIWWNNRLERNRMFHIIYNEILVDKCIDINARQADEIGLAFMPIHESASLLFQQFPLINICDINGQHIHCFQLRYFPMLYADKLAEVSGKLFINGKYIASKGKPFDVVNPATEQVIGQSVAATKEEVDLAVQSARKAYNTVWRRMDAAERGKCLYKLADLIEANKEWLGYFETLNNGKPINTTHSEDIPCTLSIIRSFAGYADKIRGKVVQMSHPFIGMTIKEPIGVVGQIIPWNYPILMMTWKIAPALAAGCTIVLKPAQQTPFTALMLGNLFNEAGFPPGVVNIVPGWGETGSFVAQHKGIDKVSFTGSTEVGYIIMRQSHKQNLKPITLELGGKSANIICPDADLDLAATLACSVFGNSGQSCVAGSRTFIHESIYDEVLKRCIAIAEGIVVGNPLDKDTQQGAVVSKEQFERILWFIEEGKKEGAKIATGGHRVGEKGYFIKPTIFTGVQDHMRIAREEIFGPVMSILKWSNEDDVIHRANALPYGLGAGVVTPNIDRALKFVQRLHAGTVYVNCYDYTEANTPFGGFKDSGIGKDLGEEGLESYLLTKTVIIRQNQL